MNHPRTRLVLLNSLVLSGLTACLSGNPPLQPRWYVAPSAPVERVATDHEPPMLRLDGVTAAPHLGERMVWRLSPVELGFDDYHRWMVVPAEAVRDALAAAVFASGRFTPAPNTDAPSLDVRVEAFDAVMADSPRVEIRLAAVHRAGFNGPTRYATFAAVEPLTDRSPEAFAIAAGAALHSAAREITDWIPTE